jgi:hypothetical protein
MELLGAIERPQGLPPAELADERHRAVHANRHGAISRVARIPHDCDALRFAPEGSVARLPRVGNGRDRRLVRRRSGTIWR